MPQLPFDIPESLASYAEHFENDPSKATKRLKKQLAKRGPDAVGHFLLAWFYHLEGKNRQAIDEALKARMFAPGSAFFKKLHYHLSHPQTFDAWLPEYPSANQGYASPPSYINASRGPDLNLDSLIQKLSEIESKSIHPRVEKKQENNSKSFSDNDADDIVSETLAAIHEKQGKTDTAIRTYKRLKELNAEKKDYYMTQISRLQKVKNDRQSGDD